MRSDPAQNHPVPVATSALASAARLTRPGPARRPVCVGRPALYRVPVRKPLDLPFDPIERAGEIWAETWGPASAMRVATSVMRVQQILLGRYDEVLRPHGLTFARYEVLVLLHFSRTGALPLKVIGSRLMVHPTSVTNAITRLVAAGLVERLANPRDRRGALASITPHGREVAEAGTRDLMAIDFGLGALDERTRESASRRCGRCAPRPATSRRSHRPRRSSKTRRLVRVAAISWTS